MLRNFDERSFVVNGPASRRPGCGASSPHSPARFRLGRPTGVVHAWPTFETSCDRTGQRGPSVSPHDESRLEGVYESKS